MGMLLMDLIRAPPVGNVVQDNLHHLHVGVFNPRHAAFIAGDVRMSATVFMVFFITPRA